MTDILFKTAVKDRKRTWPNMTGVDVSDAQALDIYYGKKYCKNIATKRLVLKYVCLICDKLQTGRVTNMQEHIRSHLGLLQFACPHCFRRFNKEFNKDVHVKNLVCRKSLRKHWMKSATKLSKSPSQMPNKLCKWIEYIQ